MEVKKTNRVRRVVYEDVPVEELAPPKYVAPAVPVEEVKTAGTDLKNWRQRLVGNLKIHKKRYRRVLVEMTLRTGKVLYFVAYLDGERFVWRGCTYVPDENTARECANLRMMMYRFHEDFAVSLAWEVDAVGLKGRAAESAPDIRTSFSPSVLRQVLKNEYTKAVVQGAAVSEMIKRTFIICIVIVLIVLAHFGVNAYKAGWF